MTVQLAPVAAARIRHQETVPGVEKLKQQTAVVEANWPTTGTKLRYSASSTLPVASLAGRNSSGRWIRHASQTPAIVLSPMQRQ
jgi:hypothetical protein